MSRSSSFGLSYKAALQKYDEDVKAFPQKQKDYDQDLKEYSRKQEAYDSANAASQYRNEFGEGRAERERVDNLRQQCQQIKSIQEKAVKIVEDNAVRTDEYNNIFGMNGTAEMTAEQMPPVIFAVYLTDESLKNVKWDPALDEGTKGEKNRYQRTMLMKYLFGEKDVVKQQDLSDVIANARGKCRTRRQWANMSVTQFTSCPVTGAA